MNERFWENLEILLIDKGMSIPVSLIVSIRPSVIISPIALCLNSNGWREL